MNMDNESESLGREVEEGKILLCYGRCLPAAVAQFHFRLRRASLSPT